MNNFVIGEEYPWAAVAVLHRSRNGIYQSRGRLVSLLTDMGRINPCYPDFHGETNGVIHYTGSGRRGDQRLDAANRALLDAVETAHAVPLFNKIAVNRWLYMGMFSVLEGSYVRDDSLDRMVWKFTLKLQRPDEA